MIGIAHIIHTGGDVETTTMSSVAAVQHFRRILEQVLQGRAVIITHYNEPRAAVVPLDVLRHYQEYEARQAELLAHPS